MPFYHKTIPVDYHFFTPISVDGIKRFILEQIQTLGVQQEQITQLSFIHHWLSVNEWEESALVLRKFVTELFDGQCPALLYNSQLHLGTSSKSAIVVTYCDVKTFVQRKLFQNHPYSLVESNGEKWLFSGSIVFAKRDSLQNTQLALDFAEQLLDHEELHPGHVVNQLAGIGVSTESNAHSEKQAFNEMLAYYYDPELFKDYRPVTDVYLTLLPGINHSFIAASKDSFPIGSALGLNDDRSTKSLLVYNINVLLFSYTGKGSNAIEQTINGLNLLNEAKTLSARQLKRDVEKCEFSRVIVTLQDKSDLEDVTLVLAQQFDFQDILYLENTFNNPGAIHMAVEITFHV